MKRYLKTTVVIGVVVLATLVATTAALAWGPGAGRIGPRAGGLEAVAEALGMKVEDLQADLKDGTTIAELAEAKGLDLAEVKASSDAVRETAVRASIEESVTDGDLTPEQADWMLRGIGEGYTPGMRGGFFGGRMFGMGGATGGLDAAAEALDMTVDELELQLWGGRSLADLAERAGVELETVQETIEAARKDAMREALSQAVEDGRLTQGRADWMIEGQENGYGLKGAPRGRGGFPGEPMGEDGMRSRFAPRGGFTGRPMDEDGMKGRVAPRGGFPGRTVPEDGAGFRAPRLRSAEPV